MKIKYILTLIIAFLVITSISFILKSRYKQSSVLSCSTFLSIIKGGDLELKTDISLFLFTGDNGLMSYKGAMKIGGKKYIINRELNFSMHSINNQGTYAISVKSQALKSNDTVPSISFQYFPSIGDTYYVTLQKTSFGKTLIRE
ncbi:hypothetical protein FKD80_23710, partial [Salmonella enterica]|nr:hypothetical protein [Salmonella enterica]